MQWEQVVRSECELGEGPLWYPEKRCLYWVDITRGRLHRFDPVTNQYGIVLEGRPIAGITCQEDGSLLLFRDRGTIEVFENGQVTRQIVAEIPEEASTRFNDVIADPAGRVFCGTMSTDDRPGRLYRLDCDGSYRVVVENVGCSNGMGFTPDSRQMYYTDSFERTIWLYDYDQSSGELSNRRPFVQTEESILPDGLTVDAAGNVWSAMWDGSCVVQYSPNGQQLQRVSLPTAQITSVAFGGADLDQLYVTSAAWEVTPTDENPAGNLFRLTPDVGGRCEFRSRIGL